VKEEAFNPLDLIEAVDVCAKLPEGWEEELPNLPKWKDKKVSC
jgi:hypothetical protein